MQQAPVLKGSGLKPLDEEESGDQPKHVFGSNLEARVVTDDNEEQAPANSFGTIQEVKKEDDIEAFKKRKFDAITGEEDEETAFQGEFKLFAWDLASSNWIEKGRGQLKLNDTLNQDRGRSRIIMRVGGTLKIVLNVAIRHSTFRVLANSKTSIRFTDSQTVWAASGSNANQLRELIDDRLRSAADQEAEDIKKKPKTDQKEDLKGSTESQKDGIGDVVNSDSARSQSVNGGSEQCLRNNGDDDQPKQPSLTQNEPDQSSESSDKHEKSPGKGDDQCQSSTRDDHENSSSADDGSDNQDYDNEPRRSSNECEPEPSPRSNEG